MMRLIIAGSRTFKDYELLKKETDEFINGEKGVTIISGLAKGADQLGCLYAHDRQYPLVGFNAEWGIYGRGAGIKRNKLMAKSATHLIAFWDGESRGTQHMIDFGSETGLKVKVVQYTKPALSEKKGII